MHLHTPQEWKESLPNIEFWSEIPGLVKDGCGFFVAKVKGLLGQGDGTYVPIGSSASSVCEGIPIAFCMRVATLRVSLIKSELFVMCAMGYTVVKQGSGYSESSAGAGGATGPSYGSESGASSAGGYY
jgi:hypothetical protein